jgi:hypothetical protein
MIDGYFHDSCRSKPSLPAGTIAVAGVGVFFSLPF